MRRDRPVYRDPVLDAWVLTRHRDVEHVIRDPSFSVDRGGSISRPGNDVAADNVARAQLAWCSDFALRWMVFSDAPLHGRLRAAIHRELTGSMVERLRPVVVAATRDALAAVIASGRMELLADLAVPVPAVVTAALLDLPREDTELLKRWTADMFALFGAGVASVPIVRAAYTSMRASHDYFSRQIAGRGAGDDLLSALVRARATSGLDDDELIGLCVTMVAGAYETTTHVVGNGLLALLDHPAQLARLRAEPALIEHAVEEIFRFDGPALSVVRRARIDTEIGGTVIAAGDRVYCMLHAANRDPARYSDPDRLDLGRRQDRHLGLGYGAHFCLGAALSRLETAVMLDAVVRELPDLEIDQAALGGGRPRFIPNLAIRGLASLPLRFTPRHGAARRD
jgi:cytochrome P450